MDYSPFSPVVQENPYPYYAHLRRHAPVSYVEEGKFWVVSRYADVLNMVKHPQIFSSSTAMDALFGDLDPWTREAPPLNGSDPPYHTRLRKLVNRAFTPRRVASLELHLREMVQRLIAPLDAQGAGDIVRDLAIPLPIMAIAELLGIPPEKYPDFKRWTEDLAKGVNWPTLPPEERAQVHRSITEVRAYFQAAIETYRKHPGDNLLSDMVRAEEESQTLSSEEVVSLAVLVLFGGAETTTSLIGNAVLALLEHPDELAKVRANPALVPNLVEEALRYEAPVQWFPRRTTREVEIAGTALPAETVVVALFGSANHDESKFPQPERFDILRNADGHLAFGFGIHFCLGAQLARLEARVAFEILLEQFPRWSRADAPIRRLLSSVTRGLETLPLVVK